MKSILFVLVAGLAVSAAGCKKKGASCADAVNHSMELSKAEMQKMPGMDDATMQKMKDIGVQHCKDDKWSDEAVKCMTDAKTMEEAQGCYGKLTKEQRHAMNQAAMEAAPTGGATPPPPTTAGSDMGSAPAGSAAPAAAGSDTGSAAAPK